MKILVLQGLPASGKSTFAKQHVNEADGNYIRVNKDDLREMLFPGLKWHWKREKEVVEIQTQMVKTALKNGKSVVVDDTNFNEGHIKRWQEMAKSHQATFEVKKLDTSVEECIVNDRGREAAGLRFVGAQVIECMAYQHGIKEQGPCILVDLDGTLADISRRLELSKNDDGSMNWNEFFEPGKIINDVPRQDIIDEVNKYKKDNDCEMVIVSGRSAGYQDYPWMNREVTIMWLERAGVEYDRLIMRQHKDFRDDAKLKEEFLDKYIGIDNVLRVWDDRPKVVRMWEGRGLDVRDCNESGREF